MSRPLKAVDFFCSGGGMSYGLAQGGVRVLGGIDINERCKETYLANLKNAKFVCKDIFDLREEDLQTLFSIEKNDDDLIFVGCSPCQYWSIIQTNKEKSAKSKDLLKEFERFVSFYNPGYVLVENVPGILRRGQESGFNAFVSHLESNGYYVHYEIVNMNDYGIPQARKRLSLVANRVLGKKVFPRKTGNNPTVRDAIEDLPVIRAGHRDPTNLFHTCAGLSEKNKKRLKRTRKNGGSWIEWADDQELKRESYAGTGFLDNYGRMCWDKPSPTITTRFFSISNGRFGHPTQTRAISIREGARIQSFPDSFVFKVASIMQAAQIIGNAVPPKYAECLALTLMEAESNEA